MRFKLYLVKSNCLINIRYHYSQNKYMRHIILALFYRSSFEASGKFKNFAYKVTYFISFNFWICSSLFFYHVAYRFHSHYLNDSSSHFPNDCPQYLSGPNLNASSSEKRCLIHQCKMCYKTQIFLLSHIILLQSMCLHIWLYLLGWLQLIPVFSTRPHIWGGQDTYQCFSLWSIWHTINTLIMYV